MTKIKFSHYMAVLLMGHMTTAPWNMFINNQAFFQSRLNYWFFEGDISRSGKKHRNGVGPE